MTDPYSNTTSFGYDDAGRRTTVTTLRGTTTYAYDAEGRVTSVRDLLGNETRTVYNLAGDVAAVLGGWPAGVHARAPNLLARIAGFWHVSACHRALRSP